MKIAIKMIGSLLHEMLLHKPEHHVGVAKGTDSFEAEKL